jgi:hypothetical protein
MKPMVIRMLIRFCATSFSRDAATIATQGGVIDPLRNPGAQPANSMSYRIRHCVECPKCWTRYLLARSPYFNGSYLIPTVTGSLEEYTLYCSCATTPARSHWRGDEMKTYQVSKAAYDRGFGTPDEVFAVRRRRTSTDAAPRHEVTERPLSSHFARQSPGTCHEIVMVARSERIVSKQNGSNQLICNPLKRGVE